MSRQYIENIFDLKAATEPGTRRSRPHKRTRSGCLTCRQRRVKCDEQHPRCLRCTKGNRACVFPCVQAVTAASAPKRKKPFFRRQWQAEPGKDDPDAAADAPPLLTPRDYAVSNDSAASSPGSAGRGWYDGVDAAPAHAHHPPAHAHGPAHAPPVHLHAHAHAHPHGPAPPPAQAPAQPLPAFAGAGPGPAYDQYQYFDQFNYYYYYSMLDAFSGSPWPIATGVANPLPGVNSMTEIGVPFPSFYMYNMGSSS
ncbi:uncharacterized protein V1510DRAFT_420897 [Dipodascopsis tothii]|uniref:uncharacterized protein n=1 Tax=Dipodascopsis tothii TaxID=44089 RepID=UPI0034CEA07F